MVATVRSVHAAPLRCGFLPGSTADGHGTPASFSAREALAAALGEVAVEDDSHVDDTASDGLADRGPWTSGELASFEQWQDEPADAPAPLMGLAAAAAAAAAAQAGHGVVGEGEVPAAEEAVEEAAEEAAAPGEEPINRGLLLKFLSSVRS